MKMESLDKILQYQDQDITWRFMQHFNVSEAEASEIFVDLLKWTWLCATALNERKEGVENVPPRSTPWGRKLFKSTVVPAFKLDKSTFQSFSDTSGR